ncbi:unnamed protein product (macronuclear) [Paramecium tetraurelia]|uniref:Mini antigen n=1 Tax=Paramecium tetraurelia TaxID=5888 RepID=A0D6R9_PARTE|nr:uncharacterized protein GSPATT00001777001 [Paramecium tetraurelia]CAK78736.1 unnamed protein product [Paramecium tetraurelia]|eukprot:XP_001446133.1 hypothetical protein (macronuclear) [Paramecium tetraurelia strain d4-2]
MKNIQLVLLIAFFGLASADIIINKSKRCECSSFIKSECDKWYDCKWNESSCLKKECSDYATEDKCTGDCQWKGGKCIDVKKECENMPTEESCSNMAGCGWKDNKCIEFTQCSDFIVTKAERCSVLQGENGERCQAKGVSVTTLFYKHLAVAAGFQCENKVYVDCSKFVTEATCKGVATATAKCQWKSDGKCYAFELKTCRDADGFNQMCDPKYCKKDGQICVNKACSDITIQAQCMSLPKIDSSKSTLCKWGADNKCAIATDATHLNEQTCNDVTFGSYHWVTDTCQQCSSNWILSIMSLIILVVLI